MKLYSRFYLQNVFFKPSERQTIPRGASVRLFSVHIRSDWRANSQPCIYREFVLKVQYSKNLFIFT